MNGPTSHIYNATYYVTHRQPIWAGQWTLQGENVPHDHDFAEFNLILGGQGECVSASGRRKLARGDFFFLRPGAWHGYHDCRELLVINCLLHAEVLDAELAWLRHEPALNYLLFAGPLAEKYRGLFYHPLSEEAFKDCLERVRELPQIVPTEPLTLFPGVGRADALGTLLRFVNVIGRDVGRTTFPFPQTHPIVASVVQFLEADLTVEWTLGELAEKVFCDPAYLARLCRKHAGLPPMALLARMRADRAGYLLARTDLPVGEVGAAVGWPNPNHFAKRFRAHFRRSPSVYREEHRQPALASPVAQIA